MDRYINALVQASDGRVISGGGDGWLLVWDLAAPGQPSQVGRSGWHVSALVPASDARAISGDDHGKLLVWKQSSFDEVMEKRN